MFFSLRTLLFTLRLLKGNSGQLVQTQQRFEVGLAAITDVHEAEAAFDQSFADEIYAENALENSYEALRELTGLEHKNLVSSILRASLLKRLCGMLISGLIQQLKKLSITPG